MLDALGLQFKDTEADRAAIRIPGYRAVLFRRETTQLGKLLQIAKAMYPRFGGQYHGQRKGDPGVGFDFPIPRAFWQDKDVEAFERYGQEPDPGMIFFCHMQNEDDKESHQGAEYDFAGWDELTHFTVTQYLYIFSRMRQAKWPGLFPRVRATANPAGPGLWWVKRRFINNCKPGEVKNWIADEDPLMNPQGLEVGPDHLRWNESVERCFIPLYLKENSILMDMDPAYANRIRQMGKAMERALLGGDWDAFGGDFFKQFDRSKEVIDPFRIPKEWYLVLSIDPGWGGICSAGLTAVDFTGKHYRIATYYERGRNDSQNARGIKDFVTRCKFTDGKLPDLCIAGKDAFAHKDLHAVIMTGKTMADVFKDEVGLLLQPAYTDRHQGWAMWKNLMPDRYFVFKGFNDPLLEEINVDADEKDPEDLYGKGNDPDVRDHTLDEQRYCIAATYKPEEKKEQSVDPLQRFLSGASRPKKGPISKGGKKAWKPGRG